MARISRSRESRKLEKKGEQRSTKKNRNSNRTRRTFSFYIDRRLIMRK